MNRGAPRGIDKFAARERRVRAGHRLAAAMLILAHAAMLVWAARGNSVTVDEYAHLPAGVAYWKYREFSIYDLSPPLLRYWAAAPVVLAGVQAPPALPLRDQSASSRHWVYAQHFMQANWDRYQSIFVLARLGMVPLSCWAAWVVFCWSASLYGPRGGLLSCALYCLDPNFIAHGSLVSTDAGAAAAAVTAAWLWWRFCRRPRSPGRLLAASTGIGAAMLCKFTTLLLWPALAGVALLLLGRNRRWRALVVDLSVAVVVAMFIVNLGYGYQGSFEPLGWFHFKSAVVQRATQCLPAWLPVPLPRYFAEGFDVQKWETEQGVPAFAMGEYYVGSRWYYYPLTLACKLPLTTLVILGATLVGMALRWRRIGVHEWVVLIFFGVLALGTAAFANMNIGIRHILPVIPMLYILAGRLCIGVARCRVGYVLPGLAVALLAGEILPVAPNFLAFFNRAVGGTANGQFLLNDSNCDWGQGLVALRKWMSDNHVDRITLAYFGRADPAVYGIAYKPLFSGVRSELVGVSSYFLAGLPYRMRLAAGSGQFTPWLQLRDPWRWRGASPVAVIDGTIHVYRRQDVELWQADGPLMQPASLPQR